MRLDGSSRLPEGEVSPSEVASRGSGSGTVAGSAAGGPSSQGGAAPRPRAPLVVALVPVIFLVAFLLVAIPFLEQDPHLPLVLATALAGLIGWSLGLRWEDLLGGITSGIVVAIPACLILMIIGVLIGTWILSGIVPTLIVYGLKVVSPAFFLFTSCFVCAVVSLATGSSWSTAGTVGIALVGIGTALGIPAGMTAGAIISGAYFGDKMSPLSDTTNLAPAVAGADLMAHVRHMAYTTGPSLVIALIIFFFLGLRFGGQTADSTALDAMVSSIRSRFLVHWALLLPPVAVIALVALRVPALPALLLGALLGALCAWLAQGAGAKAILGAAQSGYVSESGVKAVDELLSRGGLLSMMKTVALIMCALAFGGVMERTGLLHSLAAAILRGARSTGSLVLRTLLTCIGMNLIAADQYMAIVIPGRMFKEAYKTRRLHPKNLSRTLEDAGTMTSALVPWNTCGAYMSSTLGVATFAYLPFAFLNLVNPLVSAFYGYTGLTMTPLDEPPGDLAEPLGGASGVDSDGSTS